VYAALSHLPQLLTWAAHVASLTADDRLHDSGPLAGAGSASFTRLGR
jgi:hypothetical protein